MTTKTQDLTYPNPVAKNGNKTIGNKNKNNFPKQNRNNVK